MVNADRRFAGSSAALGYAVLWYVGAIIAAVSGGAAPATNGLLGGPIVLLGTWAYRSRKRTQLGVATWFKWHPPIRHAIELGALALAALLVIVPGDLLVRLYYWPVTNLVVPIWVLAAYISLKPWVNAAPSSSRAIETVAFALLAEGRAPFSDWHEPRFSFPPSLEQRLLRERVNAYQAYVFFELLHDACGANVSSQARAAAESGELAAATSVFETIDIIEAMVTFGAHGTLGAHGAAYSERAAKWPREFLMAVRLLAETRTATAPNENDLIGLAAYTVDEDILAVAQCLAFGRDAAVHRFQPVIASYVRRPAINTFPPHEYIYWSAAPGCFERHLQRRNGNPLFERSGRSTFTVHELAAARARDQTDAMAFRAACQRLRDELSHLPATISLAETASFIRTICDLIQRGVSIGAIVDDEIADLHERRGKFVEIACVPVIQTCGVDAATHWLRTNTEYLESVLPYEDSFVAQFPRLPSEDVPGALLSEDVETLRILRGVSDFLPEQFMTDVRAILDDPSKMSRYSEKLHVLLPNE